ncbi:kinase-like domain-containing protein [Staphylotrichum tortipilum]|uniref:Kinase-like domain-containing protein n=1 Tax=Staphylotrichum tortipilum TaxID=2831512 RepID=A0AAN6MSF7_9PEZI|nr:kinase-like domain-containing protein [Staphylotrichum longicolle]
MQSTTTTEPRLTSKPLPKWLKLHLAASNFVGRPSRLSVGNIIVLPFGKILKFDAPANEIAAMEFVRVNTTIPVPKILAIYDRQPSGTAHILMTQLPGIPLDTALPTLTPSQLTSIARQLASFITQLRALPPSQGPNGALHIGGTAPSTPGYDHRLGSQPWGPFPSFSAFHTFLRFGEPLADWEPAVAAVHARDYGVRFAHADLAPRNVLVDPREGRVTGVVDWEFAGWYPEYWEYTKMFYGGVRPGQEGWFEAVRGEVEEYEEERRAEEVVWMRAGPFGYG